jgi:hypothetical protein
VILSHRLWQSRLNSDPAIIGRTITLAGKAQVVVGVLPAYFIFPDSAAEPDLYVPAGIDTDTSLQSTDVKVYTVLTIARLRDGVTLPQAQAELNLFEQNRVKGYGPFFVNWAEGRKILAQPLQRYLTGDNREPLLILLACVGAVLLIACVNVANLQLARTVSRAPEMALRGALGAGRLRLIRQSLVENLTLSAIASVLGLGIAAAVRWLIRQSGSPGAVRQAERRRRSQRLGSRIHRRPRAADNDSLRPCSGDRILAHRSAHRTTRRSARRLLRPAAAAVAQRFARLRDRSCRAAAHRRGPAHPQLCACASKRHRV